MAKKKEKNRNKGDELQLEMTPMIDVVFQLLIFFIVTLNQPDILSTLDALRPQPSNTPADTPDEPTTVGIGDNAGPYFYTFNGMRATEENLKSYFKQTAKTNKDKMIVVNCVRKSPHGLLVRCLDVLRESGLHNVSIFTL
ncbi:MAG: biopolymer transporter ExbD [Kiritimatiellae bacterium]|nr:biopolymer transporter ExbD [Kiritimatiellia bacterium]